MFSSSTSYLLFIFIFKSERFEEGFFFYAIMLSKIKEFEEKNKTNDIKPISKYEYDDDSSNCSNVDNYNYNQYINSDDDY